MNPDDEQVFREYERELDAHHTKLPLWAKARPEAIYAVLTIPDAVFFTLMSSPVPPVMTAGFAQKLKSAEDGVTQALRWLTQDGCSAIVSVADRDLIHSAHEFTLYASDYVDIADFHMMYGRGLAELAVDSAAKTVTFDSLGGPGQSNTLAWHEQVRDQAGRGLDLALATNPADAGRVRRVLGNVSYDLVDGRIVLDRLPDDLVDQLGEAILSGRKLEPVPLPAATDMLGFTIAEFWRFITAVTAWSHAAFLRYVRCVHERVPQHQCMPTQLVADDVFMDQTSRLSGLASETVSAILERLSVTPGPKADILLTPFLRSDGQVAWSPAGIIKMRHERNLLKVMARGPQPMQNHAATVNGQRDRPLASLIGAELNKRGYQYKLETPVAAGGDETDIDILLWHSQQPDEVLVVEAKILLAPAEVNEVNDAAGVMLAAQEQVERALRILEAMPIEDRRRKFRFVPWEAVRRVVGIVVTSDAEPHSLIDPLNVPVITLGTLRRRMRTRDFRSPRRLRQACIDRAWLEGEIEEGQAGHADVVVGAITYRLPVRVMDTKPGGADEGKLAELASRTVAG